MTHKVCTPTGLAESLFLYPYSHPDRDRLVARYLGMEEEKIVRVREQFGSLMHLAGLDPGQYPPFLTEEEAERLHHLLRMVRLLAVPERLPVPPVLGEVVAYVSERISFEEQEVLVVVPVDLANQVLCVQVVGRGDEGGVAGTVAEVFRWVIRLGAAGFLVIHNHPGGDVEPSPTDLENLEQILQVADLLGVRVIDYVITSPLRWLSMALRERDPEKFALEIPEDAGAGYILEVGPVPGEDAQVVGHVGEGEAPKRRAGPVGGNLARLRFQVSCDGWKGHGVGSGTDPRSP
jgi:DNA repair protein RadC